MKLINIRNEQSSLNEYLDLLIIRLSSNNKIMDINKYALSIINCLRQDAIGKNLKDFLKKYRLRTLISSKYLLKRSIKSPKNARTIIEINRQKLIISWRIIPQANREIILIGKDITLQIELQNKIYELDSIIAQMPGNVYWYDKNFIYLGCNENSAKTLRMPREKAIGKNFEVILRNVKDIKDDTINEWIRDGLDVLETRTAKLNVEEPPFVGPNGELIYTVANKIPLRNKNGEVYGVLGISTDITRRKQAEECLQNAKEQAEKSNKIKSIFLASIADSLNNSIDNILGLLQKTTKNKYIINGKNGNTSLSQRELVCLFFIAKGKIAKEIATVLKISVKTVESHIATLKNKLGCYNRAQLVEVFLKIGLNL